MQQTKVDPWNCSLCFNEINLDQELGEYVSRLSLLELFWVLAGSNKVCCISVKKKKIKYVKKWLEEKGFAVEESEYSHIPIPDRSKANFHNWTRCFIGVDDSEESYGELFISKEQAYARIAKDFRFDDRIFGHILGYPSCCIEFYNHWLDKKATYGNDLVSPSIQSIEYFPCLNNNLLRYFGYSFVNHFPCSPQCSETKKIANNNYTCLRQHSPMLAKAILRHMCSLVIYTENDGIAYSTSYDRKGNVVHIKNCYVTRDTLLEEVLSDFDEILIQSYDSFCIGKSFFSKNSRVVFFY